MARLITWSGAVLLAAIAMGAGAAPQAPEPTGRLTLVVWLEDAAGTSGHVASPAAICEVAPSGAGAMRRISDDIGSFADPAWNRSGTMLAFVRYDGNSRRSLLQVTPASPWRPRTVASSSGRLSAPAWAPDGTRLAFVADAASRSGLHIIGVDGKANRLVVAGRVASPDWSGDGRFLVYGDLATPTPELWLVGADGSDRRKLAERAAEPAWSPDGRRIGYVERDTQSVARAEELAVILPDGSGRTRVSVLADPPTAGPRLIRAGRPAWAPDGAWLAAVRTAEVLQPKGSRAVQDLVLVEVDGPAQRTAGFTHGVREPAWRLGTPPTPRQAALRPCVVQGDRGTGRIRGTAYGDLLQGYGASETILGLAGDDWIHAGGGSDQVMPGPGRDEVWTGRGRDTVSVRDGMRDIVHCGEGASDVGSADRVDVLLGSCRGVARQ